MAWHSRVELGRAHTPCLEGNRGQWPKVGGCEPHSQQGDASNASGCESRRLLPLVCLRPVPLFPAGTPDTMNGSISAVFQHKRVLFMARQEVFDKTACMLRCRSFKVSLRHSRHISLVTAILWLCNVYSAMSLQVKCGGLQATAGVALTSQSTVNKLLAVTCNNRQGL